MTNFYAVLNLGHEASHSQIHKSYQRRARGFSGTDLVALREAQQAYSVLSDPERRRAYDSQASRAEPLIPRKKQTGVERLSKSGRSSEEVSLTESFEKHAPSFEELFERFWSNFDLLTRPKSERLESLTVEVPISREQASAGGHAQIFIPARARCPSCSGHGAVGAYECWHCSGQGSITAEHPLDVVYPPGVANEHVCRVPLNQFGIENFYLTVRFRVTEENE